MVKVLKYFLAFKNMSTTLLLSMVAFLCKNAPEPISICNLVDH